MTSPFNGVYYMPGNALSTLQSLFHSIFLAMLHIIIFILHEELRFREVKQLSAGLTDSKWPCKVNSCWPSGFLLNRICNLFLRGLFSNPAY